MAEFILRARTEEQAEFCRKFSNMQEIVRCKNCANNIGGRCKNLDLWVETDPEWFCADGRNKGAK